MTANDLKDILDLSVQLLKWNRQAIDDPFIQLIREFLNELKPHSAVQSVASDVIHINRAGANVTSADPVTQIFDVLTKILDMEEKLIGKTGQTLEQLLTNLQQRPIILNMLARMLQ
jgi:site-specific recombinase